MTTTILVSLILTAISIAVLFFLVRSLLLGFGFSVPTTGIPQLNLSKYKDKRILDRIHAFKTALDSVEDVNDVIPILEVLRQTGYLEIPITPISVRALQELHLSYLDRVVAVLELRDVHFDELGKLEELFQERSQLLSSFMEIFSTEKKISLRTASAKANPAWAQTEIKRQKKEYTEQLEVNTSRIQSTLRRLFTWLESDTSSPNYH